MSTTLKPSFYFVTDYFSLGHFGHYWLVCWVYNGGLKSGTERFRTRKEVREFKKNLKKRLGLV